MRGQAFRNIKRLVAGCAICLLLLAQSFQEILLFTSALLLGLEQRAAPSVMASKFLLAVAGWVSYDVLGGMYDQEHHRGIGPVIFASICTWIASHDPLGLPEDDIGHKIIALSLILWPGWIWSMAAYALFSDTQERSECIWIMTLSSLMVWLGLPVLAQCMPTRDALHQWRFATALGSMGVVTGHVLSKSNVGGTVSHRLDSALSCLSSSPAIQMLAGTATMMFSAFRMRQHHLYAAKIFLSRGSGPKNSIAPNSFPPFWGVRGPLHILSWIIGLALCASVVDSSQIRATLVSVSIAIFMILASIPPFLGKRGPLSFEGYTRLLAVLHVAPASIICCRSALIYRSREVPG